MKYKIDGDNQYKGNIVHDVLKRRGVKNVERYLNLDDSVIEPPELYENMKEGATLLSNHINAEGNIHILIDTDVDGLTSAAIMYLYVKDLSNNYGKEPHVTYHINKGKKHGIEFDNKNFKPDNTDLLIVPDAGSSDREQVEILSKSGVDVLIIDHHELEDVNVKGTPAVLINNQDSPNVKNKNMSGAGVVYKFCKYMDEYLGLNFADRYLDLFALGTVGDMMDLREHETRHLVTKGLKRIDNHFMKEIAEKNAFMMGGAINPTTIGWNIAPSLNATIRVGKPKERLDMFEALIGVDRDVRYKTTKVDEIQTLQKTMARVCGNVKGRQDRAVVKNMEEIQNKINKEGLAHSKVLIVNVTGLLDTSYTGLVANKLASYYKRPVVLLQEMKENHKMFGGSGRGYEKHTISDLRQYLLNTGFFEMCAGHPNAFGVKIDKRKVSPLIDHINKDLQDVVIEDVYTVDYEIPMHKLTTRIIKEVGDAEDLWGKGIEEPLVAITDIRVNSKDVELYGTRGKTIRFKKGDISFQRKFANEELYDEFVMKTRSGMNVSKNLNYTIIGKLVVNDWNGKKYYNVDVIDFKVKEEDRIQF